MEQTFPRRVALFGSAAGLCAMTFTLLVVPRVSSDDEVDVETLEMLEDVAWAFPDESSEVGPVTEVPAVVTSDSRREQLVAARPVDVDVEDVSEQPPVVDVDVLEDAVDLSGEAAGVPADVLVGPATVTTGAVRGTVGDVGDVCVDRVDARSLNQFWSARWGAFEGADYQRAFDLGRGRVLWVFQDAFLSGRLVHNAAVLQTGRCFSLLNVGTDNWLFDDQTSTMSDWWWIMDGNVDETRGVVELVVAEMAETGSSYLSRTRVVRTVVVTVDASSLQMLATSGTFDANPDVMSVTDSGRFYGWSVVDDAGDGYRYLFSHCYAQFGFDGVFGGMFGAECGAEMFLARVAGSSILGVREFWTGNGWSSSASAAVPVVDGFLTGAGNNPGAVMFDSVDRVFRLVVATDDWWSDRVVFAVAQQPQGPWTVVGEERVAAKCDRCNSYYASWAPRGVGGELMWMVGHNHWDVGHTSWYFPSVHEFNF